MRARARARVRVRVRASVRACMTLSASPLSLSDGAVCVCVCVCVCVWHGVAWQKGDGILVPTPVYPPFLAAPTNVGCAVLPVPLLQPTETATATETWRLDWSALEAAVQGFNRSDTDSGTESDRGVQRRVCALLLCSPHNPTGHTFSVAELVRSLCSVSVSLCVPLSESLSRCVWVISATSTT